MQRKILAFCQGLFFSYKKSRERGIREEIPESLHARVSNFGIENGSALLQDFLLSLVAF